MKAPDIAEAERDQRTDPTAISAIERFRHRFGAHRVPGDLQQEDLSGWSLGKLSRKLFIDEIKIALETRRMATPNKEIKFRTICNFEYDDNAKMTTIALVFYSPDEESALNSCAFENLEFLQAGGEAVFIPTPKLTLREFRQLESQLPLENGRELDIGHIPPKEAKDFAAIYRYLPNFAVIES